MATIRCRCEKMFSDGGIPCEYEYHLLPDVSLENVVDKEIKLVREAKDEADVGFAILSASKHLYKCPYCGRLIVFWDGLDQQGQFYKPE